jgi:hypothetical protein
MDLFKNFSIETFIVNCKLILENCAKKQREWPINQNVREEIR